MKLDIRSMRIKHMGEFINVQPQVYGDVAFGCDGLNIVLTVPEAKQLAGFLLEAAETASIQGRLHQVRTDAPPRQDA